MLSWHCSSELTGRPSAERLPRPGTSSPPAASRCPIVRGFGCGPGGRLRLRAGQGVTLRLDATEAEVRRPVSRRGGRRAFLSGKKKQNTMKATVAADERGRTLWAGNLRTGRMHDTTAIRARASTASCVGSRRPKCSWTKAAWDSAAPPGQGGHPPRKPNKISPPEVHETRERACHKHSTRRIPLKHALADHKRGKGLTHWTITATASPPPTPPSLASSATAPPLPEQAPPTNRSQHRPHHTPGRKTVSYVVRWSLVRAWGGVRGAGLFRTGCGRSRSRWFRRSGRGRRAAGHRTRLMRRCSPRSCTYWSAGVPGGLCRPASGSRSPLPIEDF